jgi:hypothetical protein
MGEMDEGSGGLLRASDDFEFLGERARQMFFDRFQRIAGNEANFLRPAPSTLSPQSRKQLQQQEEEEELELPPVGQNNSEEKEKERVEQGLKEGEMLFERYKLLHGIVDDDLRPQTAPSRASPTPTSTNVPMTTNKLTNPLDNFLQTCINEKITPEPTIVKKSYVREKLKVKLPQKENRSKDQQDVDKQIYEMRQRFMNKHHTDTLMCSDYGMGDKRALALADALQSMKFILTLDLQNNRLTERSLPTLLEQLKHHTNITDLNLSNNTINNTTHAVRDDKGNVVGKTKSITEVMVAYLKTSDSIRVLKLDDCKITDEVAMELVPGFIRKNALHEDVNGVEEVSQASEKKRERKKCRGERKGRLSFSRASRRARGLEVARQRPSTASEGGSRGLLREGVPFCGESGLLREGVPFCGESGQLLSGVVGGRPPEPPLLPARSHM